MLFRLAFTAGGVLAAVTYMRKGALNHAAFLSVAEAAVAAAGGGIGRMIGGLNGARNLLASKSNQPNFPGGEMTLKRVKPPAPAAN